MKALTVILLALAAALPASASPQKPNWSLIFQAGHRVARQYATAAYWSWRWWLRNPCPEAWRWYQAELQVARRACEFEKTPAAVVAAIDDALEGGQK